MNKGILSYPLNPAHLNFNKGNLIGNQCITAFTTVWTTHNAPQCSPVELEAAIYAASKFATQSRTFSVNMRSKIAEMIQDLATPVNTKLKLIPILQYMHHDAYTAAILPICGVWTTSNVDGLISLLLDQPYLELHRRTLDVLVTLAMAEASNYFFLQAAPD
ncbi:hypothetical protein DAPPUDRAFT_257524 [Daphnia pulex]|uniref:Integrator complex subunit 7 N-terminal domain-containing protein n=1 Tax=Daphnia pulex TaxID=6669 RepID=E9HDR7_DAPPU|nr:hypothetical protein DAPPUDRAFT_257524 [Daphnia pulex]|eukprot:EFX70122.1 hypothetical protein DAPPUDRAFT_257524 [Daphnia pulex]